MDAEKAERRRRRIEAAVALLQSAPGQRMQITNLNKALFYLDLAALRDTGRTITGNRYLALPQGPVFDGYKDQLIPDLIDEGLARQDDEGMAQPVVLTRKLDSFHYHFLDDHLRSLAARVAPAVAAETAASISDISHKNPGWRLAYAQGHQRGYPPCAINMFIAMQQIASDDPWLTEPAETDRDVDDAFAMAELDTGEPW